MAGLALGPMGWPGYRHGSLGLSRPPPGYYKRSGGRRRMQYRRGGRFKGKKFRRVCLLGLNPEKKFVDLAVNSGPATTGSVILMSLIPQGDGESQRVGRKAIITDYLFHGHWELTAAQATTTSNRVRIAIVQDTQTNGVAMTAALCWNTAGTADINAFRDLSLIGRFKVLYDKSHVLNAGISGNGTTSQTGEHHREVRINLKCCIPIEYDASASTGAIGTQQVNSLHLVMWEENATPATLLQGTSRIRYVD